MKEAFRQSMAWLHTWVGLLVGWVLFFVFLTGTLGYVNAEVDLWMRPEQPQLAAFPPAADMLASAEQRLRERSGEAEEWLIIFPGDSGVRGAGDLVVGRRAWPVDGEMSGKRTLETLDPRTGLPIEISARETAGGHTLYRMHYVLHYVPEKWGRWIVGIATMLMLVAIITGTIAHKKIFRDFFTFRSARGQRSWLDGHNLLAVTALPFHVMITWSGLVFFQFMYMPVAIDMLYPEGTPRDRFFEEAYGFDQIDRDAARPAAPLVSLLPLLARAEEHWGTGSVYFITVDNPGRENARIIFSAQDKDSVDRTRAFLRFDGVTGSLLESGTGTRTAAGWFNGVLLSLHEGRFAGPVLRFLYALAGLIGTAMIGTGLVLWSTKRKAKLLKTDKPHFGIAVVDVLNLGTVVGLPVGIAAYFWANRLLPVEMPGRAAWEVHAMFIVWGLTFLYAIARSLDRAWVELCWLAAAACTLLPLLNALTTDRHLGVSLSSGDWVFVGFDLSALAAGLFFALMARHLDRRKEAVR
jgi:uncharacterized iron-regulated membrane protein